ncbi:MAG: hypothetical protein GX141_10525 [Armatimonadetes bacterium]|nr:hypothetical protein [Armatimonadota bacterium]
MSRSVYILSAVVIASICVVSFNTLTSADSVPKAEALMLQQAAYFQKIGSLDFTATRTTTLSESRQAQQGENSAVSSSKVRFRYKQGKFIAEIGPTKRYPGSHKATIAYDGTEYQFLGDGALVNGPSKLTSIPYGTSLPPFNIFAFLLLPEDDLSLLTFQDDAKWRALASRITSVTPGSKLGHTGCMIAFEKPATVWPGTDKDQHKVFFAEELGYLPIYWETRAKTTIGQVLIESQVTKFKSVTSGLETLMVPTAIKTAQYLDGVIQEENTDSVTSVIINGDIDDSNFKLSNGPAPEDNATRAADSVQPTTEFVKASLLNQEAACGRSLDVRYSYGKEGSAQKAVTRRIYSARYRC